MKLTQWGWAGGAVLWIATTSALVGAQDAGSPLILKAEIRGSINPASSRYLQQAIEKAEAQGAEALIVELDTPGGLLSSAREMTQSIDGSRVPVVVYVHPAGASATSAGAILMLASHVAAMSPGTNIGAAHPVGPGGEDIPGAMKEKAVSDVAAFARGLAEIRGRPRDLADAIVTKSQSFTSDEALQKRLIEVQAASTEELVHRLDGREVITRAGKRKIQGALSTISNLEMSFGQKLLHFLSNPNVTAILFSLGALLIYIEISAPGISVAGISGAICLLIAFMGTQLLPIRTGALALMMLGVILLIAEIFVTSFGLLGVGGIVSFVLGLIWLIDPSASSLGVSPAVWVPIAIVMTSAFFLISRAVLKSQRMTSARLRNLGAAGLGGLTGYRGKVESVRSRNGDGKMTQGKALVRGELWDFECEGDVSVGDPVEVIDIRGMIARIKRVS